MKMIKKKGENVESVLNQSYSSTETPYPPPPPPLRPPKRVALYTQFNVNNYGQPLGKLFWSHGIPSLTTLLKLNFMAIPPLKCRKEK